jgi:RNA polymerase sigma-B factor
VDASFGVDDAGFRSSEARVVLKPLLAHLTDRERIMLEMRFFGNATQSEIGEAIGITQMQVSRLLSDLMGRLREQLLSPPKSGRGVTTASRANSLRSLSSRGS